MVPLIGTLVSGVFSYFTDRQKVKAAVTERKDELRKLNLESKIADAKAGLHSDIEQDTIARQISGFMDDFSFYSVWTIVILAFVPDAQPHIMAGFKTLEEMPDWFKVTVGLMLAAVWGYRRLVVPIVEVAIKHYAKRL